MQLCQINPPVSTKYGLSAREDNEITWMDVIENFNVIYISIHSTCCWLTQCSILTYWKAHAVSHQGKVVNQSLDCPKAPKCWESNYHWRETYLLCSSTLIRLAFSLLLCTFVLLKHYFHLHSRCKQSEVVFAIQSTRRVMMTYCCHCYERTLRAPPDSRTSTHQYFIVRWKNYVQQRSRIYINKWQRK